MVKNVIVISLCLLTLNVFAQRKYDMSKEFGISFGTAYYIGDLNQKHFGTRANICGGMMYRNNLSRRISVKGALMYGRIEAWDEDSDDPWQQNRNLHFRNDLLELSVQGEINYFNYQIGDKEDFISPYLFLGLAFYSMRPEAEYLGNWYELQPLGTEGQGTTEGGKKYATSSISAPFGAGLKVNLFSIIALNLEWGMRKTWSDYLDDVSGNYVAPAVLAEENGELSALMADRSLVKEGPGETNAGSMRGDPGRKDWYNFTTVTLSVRLGKSPTSCWK